jgi:hypothetical protein
MAETNTAVKQPDPVAPPPKQPARVEGTRAAPATNLYEGSPQDRWLADQAAADKNDPWRDPNVTLTRDAAGNLVAHEKKIGADGEPTIGKALDQPDGDAAKPADAPADGADGDKLIKIGDTELTQKQWLDAITSKAEADSRTALIPKAPGEYRLEFPKEMKLPVGVTFELASLKDPIKGPLIQNAQAWAHANKLSQGQFSDLLALYATSQAHENITTHERAKAEAASLGVTAPARMDAIAMFLRGHYGDTAAKPMLMTLSTRHQVEIWEDVIRKITNGGGGSFSQRGREVEPQTISDEAYNKLSYSQKVQYAADATARAANNGRR